MRYTLFENQKSEIILLARILIMIIFITSGWNKLTGFSGTTGYLESQGVPFPMLATAIAVAMELFVAIFVIVGFYTRPISFIFALFTLATAVIGHDFWTMADSALAANMTQFFKNLSIVGGFLLLGLSGPGKYSIDGK